MMNRPFRLIAVAMAAFALAAHAAPTRNNDDSCDIALLPAATLLLPYFEVSANGQKGTLITITNGSPQEQIAHVTLWTDYSYPVVDFNVYLTGYDVQSISLYDVIWRGVLSTQSAGSPTPSLWTATNPRLDLSDCASLPTNLSPPIKARIQSAFTLGRVAAPSDNPACNTVGGVHTAAVGYATIDVVRRCTSGSPATAGYLSQDILWDNVLIGDYQQFDLVNGWSEGDPMVHIRAVSEGGTAVERRSYPGQYEVRSGRTFYSRYQQGGTFDARQPLPSRFAAHWSAGSAALYRASFKIWREGATKRGAVGCSSWPVNNTTFTEVVIFDEEENPRTAQPSDVITPINTPFILPATSLTSVIDHTVFPAPTNGSVAGWVYMNLDNDEDDGIASQNWMITTLRAEGQFSVDEPAFALGNGCSPASPITEISGDVVVLGPAPNVNPEE